ncbi:hypothetical protein PRZ48_008254 [Zasmidium cellare]|uniref:Zn(2)-C6 fungal-type domain-containing protein n=1 Tax=Zasmidium cellare TaxID=395010 RepID=A0ABR0EG29_ZASCE|nr:hypothetical protein PRZ48_008254 [Zasmidium cellare]
MATTDGGPFLPVGYDIGFDDLHYFDGTGQSLPLFPELADMTQLQFDEDAIFLNHHHSPNDTVSSRSDVRSPGKQSLQATAGGSRGSSSLSPAGDALIYTPTSTLLEFQDDAVTDSVESDQLTTSPDSNHTDDFVHVGSDSSGYRGRMNIRPPRQPGVSPSTQPSLPSRESSVPQTVQATRPLQPWHSFASSSSTGMDDTFIPYSSAAELGFSAGSFADEAFLPVGDLDGSFNGQTYGNIPFRPFTELPTSFDQTTLLSQQATNLHQHQHVATSFPEQRLNPTFNAFSQQQFGGFNAHDFAYQGNQLNSTIAPPQPSRVVPSNANALRQPTQQPLIGTQPPNSNISAPSRSRRQPHPQLQHTQSNSSSQGDEKSANPSKRSPTNASGHNYSTSTFSARPSNPYPSIVKREPAQPSTSSTGPVRSSQTERARRGGRTRNSHLTEHTRQKSHAMRKVGACWRCAMQRDPCDDGNPCSRCLMRSQRGQTYFFDCDRSKLPDFVHDFLPPQASMTLMHQKQSIEDTVSEQVFQWDLDNGIDVYLSSGYGPPLRWTMFEFKPRTNELLSQLQYFQNASTGRSVHQQKYSPPFGLIKIDTSDDAHFDTYLDQLLEPQNLLDFGWSCYEEESQVDPEEFQAKMLDFMCQLHMRTADESLRLVLRDILRMLIITYIMGHTLTIVEETLPTVISHVRHSNRPDHCTKYTSPRLANRQLKFFFAVLRNNIYEKILKWQQQTLHTAGKKEETWLQTFCVMLGFAMVLEEVQRLIQIQADASVRKEEMMYDDAQRQAYNACERIDERYKLLIGLFQCKYRDRKWGERGSFGNGTPELKEPAQKDFLRSLRSLVLQRYDHLKSRENVPFGTETQCLYTTRLTARFLLPFLNLPA